MKKENNMELFDLDDVDLVVSYTIQILFIAKSANSPKILLYISIASTHTDRQWKGTGLELTKNKTKKGFCCPSLRHWEFSAAPKSTSVKKCSQSLKMNYCFLCRACVRSADYQYDELRVQI